MKRQKTPPLTSKAFRRLLLTKRAELLKESGTLAASELGRVAADDEAPILHDQFISLQMRTLDYQTLRQIDAALARLATGDFGVCVSCGDSISTKRLAAIPWAHCCIDCQERMAYAHHAVGAAAG